MAAKDAAPRWLQLTRKELGDASRSWRLQLLVGFFAVIGAGIGYAVDQNYAAGLLILLVFLAPLVGSTFAHHTIVQKRNSGELSVLLSLPFSRRNIVIGAYLGRTAILFAALSSLALTVTLVGTVTGSPPELAPFLAALLISATLGTVFVSLAIGLSAAARTSSVASAGVFGAYLLFAFQIWSLLPDGVLYLANGFSAPAESPEWALVFEQLSPFAAVRNLATPYAPDLAELFPLVGAGVPANPPVYMQPWFAGLVTLCWLVLPAVLGYLRFERTDL